MDLNETPQRVRWTTIVVLAGLAILFMVLDSTGNLDDAFAFVRDPMAVVLEWTAARADAFADVFAGPRDVQQAQQRIAELEAQNAALQRELTELREIQSESQLYIDLFNRAREAPEFERRVANVIGRDTSPVFRSLIIDRGSDDGVVVGMPVESARGLVGVVYRTSPSSAQVLLVTDNISNIPARLSTSRATGKVEGGGLGGSMTMEWIDLEAQVDVGDVVLTSGLGGKFPQDLVIGRVIEVQRSEAELFQTAILQPAVDFEALEVVFVITGFPAVDTGVFDEPPETFPENP